MQDRLARDRANRPAASDREQELARREQDLVEREQKLAASEVYIECREHLRFHNINMKYLELLDTSDPEKFKADVEKFRAIAPIRTGLSHQYGSEGRTDEFADAFKPKGTR